MATSLLLGWLLMLLVIMGKSSMTMSEVFAASHLGWLALSASVVASSWLLGGLAGTGLRQCRHPRQTEARKGS